MIEKAGYLPLSFQEKLEWQTLTFKREREILEIEIPILSEEQLSAVAEMIKKNSRTVLKSFTVNQIINILDQTIAKFLDKSSYYRQKAEKLLPIITGYNEEIIRLGLTSYLKTFRKPQLYRFLTEDFENPMLLDDFQPRPKGGFSKAVGQDLVVHIWAGNVPALPIWSLISSLMVKSGNIGKVSSNEPLFAGLFVQALVEIEPRLADCVAIVWWKGGDKVRESRIFSKADLVVGYGSNQSLASLREQIPITTRFLPFGHKISFGMVSNAALDARKAVQAAHDAANDIIRYDQQGCYSPHFFFVEKGGSVSPKEFARYVAYELACFEERYPKRELSIEEMTANAAWQNREELSILHEPMKEIISNSSNDWTVVYEEDCSQLIPSCLNRVIKIIAVDQLDEIIEYIEPFRSLLQTVGIAATPEELFSISDLLAKAGVTRITALGNMTSPESGWHHDGRFNLSDLVNIVDIEHSAEDYSEKFALYVD
ncbi:Acyl-CoA reductase (LuxC) [Desulfonispora thiosulfatigenes DSM 11270]|uniref:Acyl-CoA reductase n=1 Tax=Desulfonispora thiosulfatigenes DSM 11270 TaxID=656914 RepID=A0A1W1UI98_DESTI|nr:acyl-CoA reductase [Desulfonispora thiosulfatigenes]SMB80826.1 Acyl-CoA reductase (LuxC) [Desulfonispora thiosulfatigenes DSM 11270]